MTIRPRVYLAGPDVFRPDAVEHLQALARSCEVLGLEPLIPSDSGAAAAGLKGADLAQAIYEVMSLLAKADGVVANLTPFRGAEPDSGTVFEIGVAHALGKPVVAYGVEGNYANRVKALLPVVRDATGALRDAAGLEVEDYGRPVNLMLACSVKIETNAAEALAAVAHILRVKKSEH